MKKIKTRFLLNVILCVFYITISSFLGEKDFTLNSQSTKSQGDDTTKTYNSLKGIVGTNFYKATNRGELNNLCIQDCLSFTFWVHTTGEITIQEFSIYTPIEIQRIIERSIKELNSIPLPNKPFVNDWIINKYNNGPLMQPILLNLFSKSCITPRDLKFRGILSLLTNKQDSGKASVSSKTNSSGEFKAPPFNGILLNPFILQSPYVRVGS